MARSGPTRRRPTADPSGHDPASARDLTLSRESAREVVGSAGPPPAPRRFLSTDHLSAEAVAAYVDGRLPSAGRQRADAHLDRCPRCRREVTDQRDARRLLRGSGPIRMPDHLRERLRSLPGDEPSPDGAGGGGRSHHEPRERSPWAGLLRRLRGLGR